MNIQSLYASTVPIMPSSPDANFWIRLVHRLSVSRPNNDIIRHLFHNNYETFCEVQVLVILKKLKLELIYDKFKSIKKSSIKC